MQVDRAVAIAPFLASRGYRSPEAVLSRVLSRCQPLCRWDPSARGNARAATLCYHALAEALKLSRDVFEHADKPIAANMLVFVTNSSEAAVNNRTIGKLEKRLRRFAQTKLRLVKLGDLPISHDIIEPLRHPEIADKVFPSLMKLIEGE